MKSHIRRIQICVFILLLSGSCQGLDLNGVVGNDIILHCATTELEENVQVIWKDGNGKDVILIQNNNQTVFDQNLSGRVTSFPGEYKNGNFSIKISKLRLDDAGFYECSIPKQHLEVQFKLNVTAEEKKTQLFQESDADAVQANLLEAPATTTNSPIDCGHTEAKWQNKIATPVSFSLNVFLALTLVFTCVCMKMRNSCCCRTKDSAAYNIENQEMQNPQYEEIQLPPTPVPVLVPVQDSSECIYYKAQHPNPKMPRY